MIQKNYDALSECFNLMEETKDKELVPYKVIRDAFRFLEIEIKESEMEYMIMNLFAYTYDLEALPFGKIFVFVENLPSSPLLKSPSKRTNSFQLKSSITGKIAGFRNSMTMSNLSKRTSNFSTMTEQTIEELTKAHEFNIQVNKNKEIHSIEIIC